MIGTIKNIINEIYRQRTNGNQYIINALKVKLVMKGICSNAYIKMSPNDQIIIEKVKCFF